MLKDLRFALLLIVKERWYSAVAVVALALGIGLNATVFTLVNAVLIRGLPFKDSGQLYMLGSQRKNGDRTGVSYADLRDWRSQTRAFTALAAFSGYGGNLSDDRSAPQQVRTATLTSNSFAMLGTQPILGRDFRPDDERKGSERVAILGYKLWKTRYSGDPSVVGTSLRINGQPTTIIGYQSVLAWDLGVNTGQLFWTPHLGKVQPRPVVLFQPTPHAWKVIPLNTAPGKRAQCQSLNVVSRVI